MNSAFYYSERIGWGVVLLLYSFTLILCIMKKKKISFCDGTQHLQRTKTPARYVNMRKADVAELQTSFTQKIDHCSARNLPWNFLELCLCFA